MTDTVYSDIQIYQGLPHGEGLMFTGEEDSCTYEGSWKHGLRHGQGKLTYGKTCTTIYEGRWVLDHKHGDGYHTYDSGSNFRGSWSQGKRNGRGRLVSLNSGRPTSFPYRGELGRLSLMPVYFYEGDWMDDLSSGRGKSVWMSNELEDNSNHLLNYYVGEYERGLRHGKGTFYYASGAIYKGEWAENKKNGVGCFIDESGMVLRGNFFKDRLQETLSLTDPLEAYLENEENPALLKERLSNVLLRHNSVLRDIYTHYSNSTKEENLTSPSPSKAMFLHQVWQLCYDANVVQCELGLAQIDWLLRPTETSWDDSSKIHKRDRQIIFREFRGAVITLAKTKFCSEDSLLDDKRYKPQWGLQRERLLCALIKGLYQCDIGFGDDGAMYLDNDINFMEFQVAIYIYATAIKDQGANSEPLIMLNSFIKEAVIPNLSIDLDTLLNEDTIPNLPNINTKGADRNSPGKGARSVPGSKRSTPREGKLPQGAKSAPQTPLRKKT
ncbi:hypothetical protein GOP47_0024440 [Adiantum capillus-veneris]|uniref:Uncharacterized protein n=1 Tax=Adiantum capillus-veneris TaxID=13818 RepID=A0A9D4U259_ADICA|nr:hypothetical protein GOP47_0024440 [Adiantum capillus-veneris]